VLVLPAGHRLAGVGELPRADRQLEVRGGRDSLSRT
jgi:hypothetical protein